MKRLLQYCVLALPVLAISLQSLAQSGPYGNEWIDYSKTYYKFKVAANGICRITRPALDAAGVPANILGSNFILYRDGKEVALYASADNMTAADYLEFAGKKADGLLDKELYGNTANHADDRISLFTDTACYYLTYDNNAGHSRYTQAANAIPTSPAPAPLTYCLNTVGSYYRNVLMAGPTYIPAELFYSSQFESGEGYVNGTTASGTASSVFLATPNAVTNAGVNATLHTAVNTFVENLNSNPAYHDIKVLVNNQQVADSMCDLSATKKFDVPVAASGLTANNEIRFPVTSIPSPNVNDYYGISYVELEYPRSFSVSGLDYFPFRLTANATAQYLEFTGYSGGAQSRLYDLTNKMWYAGDVSVAGKVRFYIQPSFTDRQLVLYTSGSAATQSLASVKTIQFINYAATAAQGDYIIVTHNALMQPLNGNNYVQKYSDYRSSAAGGGHTVVTADVTNLYDEFAYGYETHPLSIRHFLQYAYNSWAVKPQYVNIIGRAILYNEYAQYLATPSVSYTPDVPIYGNPGADLDFINFGGDYTAKMSIGRIPVRTAGELSQYLAKLIRYETVLQPSLKPTAATEDWKKQVLHVAGADDAGLRSQLLYDLNQGAAIVQDTFTGYSVSTVSKTTTSAADQINGQLVDSLVKKTGLAMITYYGHGSNFTLDYNLPSPSTYTNDHLPFFQALGCNVAQMFDPVPDRTVMEQYVLAPNSGAIAMVAGDGTSTTDFDAYYIQVNYAQMAYKAYGASLGRQFAATYNTMVAGSVPSATTGANKNFASLESLIFAGDPATYIYQPAKPDYYVGSEGIAAIPGNVTTTVDSFQLRISTYNLAKAVPDTVQVKVEHRNPAGSLTWTKTYNVPNLYYGDTTTIWVPLNKLTDLGQNKYTVIVDANNRYDELSEDNNKADFSLFIYSNNLVPVYPKEFDIVSQQDVTLKASTLNPFRAVARYRMQLDTTEQFNSPSLMATTITSAGGVIKWKPGITMPDSTVYYWRAAFDSTVNGALQWTRSSFVYLAKGSPGWNQSHYYQYTRDGYSTEHLDADRTFRFDFVLNDLEPEDKVFVNPATDATKMFTYQNGSIIQRGSQSLNSIQVMVIDTATGAIFFNDPNRTCGAITVSDNTKGYYSREFDLTTPANRNKLATFLSDTIKPGNYVMIKNIFYDAYSYRIFIDQWKADTAIYGAGKSLYNAIYNLGFTSIDSYNRERVFVFWGVKGAGAIYQQMTDSLAQILDPHFIYKSFGSRGQMVSTVIGPATSWTALKWKEHAADAFPQYDTSSVSVYGIDASGGSTLLLNNKSGDTTLAFISAVKYPNLQLVWMNADSVKTTAPQPDYWRVLYAPVPEAALNPAIRYVFSDSLNTGQQEHLSVAIEDLNGIPMDSMLVRYKVIDASGTTHLLANKRYRKLGAYDTLNADITFDPAAYPGRNVLFVEANPDNDQPEQYHPNNLGYLPFKIVTDTHNPLLDVTFDGIHILDHDIVSAKPMIEISLKDENQYLALNDTSLLAVSVITPRDTFGTAHPVPFDGTVCRFIPATIGPNGKNEAKVEYHPTLTDDGTYELIVTGKDRSGNGAGTGVGAPTLTSYRVAFDIENKPTVTNVLNYPNPFSTATSFLFTITGSQIPSQFKIQILSVTGRVVREITKPELGALHIGRNITDYKWDGRDQYGQLLGNGVYLYRVVTSLNGNDIEHRSDAVVDKYFKNGYGKMYIMR